MPKVAPQPGPQTAFSATVADVAFYGGSAGGGKTWCLAFEAARYTNQPNYAGVIFRRTSPELTGGGSIWSEAQKLYPILGGTSRDNPNLDWRFPKTAALIEFRHLQHEKDVFSHQSKQYDFIGLDEATHFTSLQFWYLMSRLRSGSATPKRMRCTCNPDPDSFVRQLIDWYIDPETGLALDARSGIIRWFTRVNEKLVWGASPDEVTAYDPIRIRRWGAPREHGDDRAEPMSFTFVRARATDNQILMKSDPGYVARLNLIPGAQAKRLRDGNWNARDVAGDYFDRSWCRIVDRIDEKTVVRRIRFWDKAATSPSAASPDPDYTRGARIALLNTGDYVWEDLASLRAGPAAVDKLQRCTAEMDGIQTEQGAWIDPGQAGKVDEEHMLSIVFLGFSFKGVPARKDKVTYARIWSPLAKAGKLQFLNREYLPELFAELEGFPTATHDDCMDAGSGGFFVLTGGAVEFAYDGASDNRHTGIKVRDAWEEAGSDDDDDDGYASVGKGACF